MLLVPPRRPRHAILHAELLEPRLERRSIRAGERRVVERARDVHVAHLARIRFTQMQYRTLAGIEPVPEPAERRPRADAQAHHVAIKRADLVEQLARSAQVVVIERLDRHAAPSPNDTDTRCPRYAANRRARGCRTRRR